MSDSGHEELVEKMRNYFQDSVKLQEHLDLPKVSVSSCGDVEIMDRNENIR
jgi:S-ribosylhomocysteine lyase LuxS involved in autoinducer biosynthesis